MKWRKTKKMVVLACFALLIILPHKSLSQDVYSRGISKRGKNTEFLKLKIIETDPILKFAKETVPFDRPFFLKIKRKSTGSLGKSIGVKTTLADSLFLVEETDSTLVTNKWSLKKEETKYDTTTAKKADTIKSLVLTRTSKRLILPDNELLGKDYTQKIVASTYSHNNQKGKVYQEKPSSEYLFIEIPNLKPGSSYSLEITWGSKKDSIETYYFTSVPAKLESRAKARLSPQFGVASVIFDAGDDAFVKWSLMFGVHYHLRAIDPDIPVRTYAALSPQRLSLILGVTLNSLAQEGARSDLFGSNNLMLGVGYQMFDGVKLSVGQLLFNELNPNQLISDDQKNLVSTLYVSATVDLQLKDLFGGVISTLGFN